MKDIRQLHRQAIALIKLASQSLQDGDNNTYMELASQAYELEKDAAIELISDFDSEPTRSVLFRSAATIGFNIGNYHEAQKLTHLALAGNPFDEIVDELQELLENCQNAIASNATKALGLQNAYIENLRENAVNIKLEPKDSRYSKAIVLDYITDFLKNIQHSFSNFSEVNFKKYFVTDDFRDYDKTFNLFKKDTKALCVGLKFKSFGVSVAVDSSLQNYRDIPSPKFKEFKTILFEDFKEEILLGDFNNKKYQEKIQKKYTDLERAFIFSPVVDSFKEKSKYKISIVDREFKATLKECPTINKKAINILKPANIKTESFDDSEILIKRTFELTNPAGQKGDKILTENLEYAEFSFRLNNINSGGKDAYFINPYDQKVIFNHGTFIVDDEYYNIYIESTDFKEVEKIYAQEIIEKFSALLAREQNSKNENGLELSIDEKKLLEIFKSTIIKGW